jgi:hypothetical protein
LSNILERIFSEAKLRKARKDASLLRRRGLCLCISLLAAFAPLGLLHFTTPMMTKGEIAFMVALMFTALALVLFLNGRQLLLGMLVIPLSLFGVSFLGFYAFHSAREAKLSALRVRLDEYLALGSLVNQKPAKLEAGQPVLLRKLIAIDPTKRDVDPIQILLPAGLRADKPDEVRTVLWLNWGEEPVGQYPRGGTAFRRFCELSAIELGQTPKLKYRNRFTGEDPPAKGGASNLYGKPPIAEILQFLKSAVE